MTTRVDPSRMANAIRALAMDAVQKANSGHPGLPMGAAADVAVLFTQFLKFDASDAKWFDRDRFVLSAGHGSMLLYALLYLTGNKTMTIEQIRNFRQLGSDHAGSSRISSRPASRRRRALSAKASPPPSAWRSLSAAWRRIRRRHRRSSYLRAGVRWRP